MKTNVQFGEGEILAIGGIAETTKGHFDIECEEHERGTREYETRAEMAKRLHTAIMDGHIDAIRAALSDCIANVGEPLLKWWEETYSEEDLCGFHTVAELIRQ